MIDLRNQKVLLTSHRSPISPHGLNTLTLELSSFYLSHWTGNRQKLARKNHMKRKQAFSSVSRKQVGNRYIYWIFALIFMFLADQRISNDVSNPYEHFANHHIVFTDSNPDHLVLCSQQQQQRQNKTKHGKFICAFFSTFPRQSKKCLWQNEVWKNFLGNKNEKLEESVINSIAKQLL